MEDNQMFQEEMPVGENSPEQQIQPEQQVQPEQPEQQVQPEQPPKAPVRDYYADGTPVRPEGHSANIPGSGRSQREQGEADRENNAGNRQEPHLRQYQFGSEWQQRQIAPQPYGKDPKKNGKGGLIAAVAIVLVISILGGAVFAAARAFAAHVRGPEDFEEPSVEQTLPGAEAKNESSAPAPTLIPAAPSQSQTQESAPSGQMSVADVAEMSMPAMVSITTMSVQQVYSFFGQIENREVPGAASGIIVGQTETELLIATNDHVISNAKDLSVAFVDEEVVEGVVKGTDEKNDLAIVAVNLNDIKDETKEQIRVISIGDSDTVRIGEEVVAIGNALGFGQSVSAGVISAKDRKVSLEDGDHVLLQTDAAINPGNSGGALLNMRGELIGINEIKYVREDTEGIGYAIPITFAKPILDELMNRETRTRVAEGESGYLGVNCITVTEEYAKAYRIPVGVFVDAVLENEAAEKAGIQPRDIITKIGDVEVTTAEGLVEELRYYAAGETVTVTVSRLMQDNEYKEIELEVTLGRRPADADAGSTESSSGSKEDNFWQMPGGNR
ncbi:MAG: trypsin-like peptidase domain-containing protein [Lachnospiraceae bacterium]|nr:trypsin-like peptidase domain-containing protein [Lachnospiraceae bacterium]